MLIFRGTITTWDDPRIMATNAQLQACRIPRNQAIELVVRADKSGTTEIFKKSLSRFDAIFAAQVGQSSRPEWQGVTVTKKGGTLALTSYVFSTVYTIGYATLAQAVRTNQPKVRFCCDCLVNDLWCGFHRSSAGFV